MSNSKERILGAGTATILAGKKPLVWWEKLGLTVGVLGLYVGLATAAPVYVSPIGSINGTTTSSATITTLNTSTITVTWTGTMLGGKLRLGTWDDSDRRTIQLYDTSSILKLGASDADSASDPNADSEGIVIYHPTTNYAARIKAERFGLTRDNDQTQYYFKVDADEFFHSSAPLTVGGTTAPGVAGIGHIEARAVTGSLGSVTARSGSQFARLFSTDASAPGISWLSGADLRLGEGSLDGGSFTERMRFKGSMGLVGLNDTDPDGQLEIVSNQAPAGFILAISSQADVTGAILTVLGNGNMGIGVASPLSLLNVQTADSGVTPHVNADEAFFEGSGNAGITIGTPNTSVGSIFFGDPDDATIGQISYDHNTNKLALATNANTALTIDSNRLLGIGTTAPETKLHLSSGILLTDGTTPYHTFTTVTSTPTTAAARASIWANTTAGSAEMKVVDGAGNVTQISPHNGEGDWIFYSENIKTGKRVYVNMEHFIKSMEKISGEQFIFDTYGEVPKKGGK